MRIVSIITGIVVAAIGGVIAYRTYFLEASTSYSIDTSGVNSSSSFLWVGVGLAMFVFGIAIAFISATRRRQYMREHNPRERRDD